MKGIIYNEEFLNFFDKKFKENVVGENLGDRILFYKSNLQAETRVQLKKLYKLQEERHKSDFYVFLMQEFGTFEFEFIIDNIFFEPKSKELFSLFKLIGLLPERYQTNNSFINSIFDFDFDLAHNELEFCLSELNEFTDINLNTLKLGEKWYPIINTLVDLLIKDIKNNVDDLTKNIKLTAKILQTYNMLPHNDSKRAIILFNSLRKKLDVEISNKNFVDIDKLDVIINTAFAELFCEDLNKFWDLNYYENNGTQGLTKQLKEYKKLKNYLQSLKVLKKEYSKLSFLEVFEELNKTNDENLHHLLYSYQKEKITKNILPSNSDLNKISILDLNAFGQNLRKQLFQKLYYYY